jgi:hypothetical protein
MSLGKGSRIPLDGAPQAITLVQGLPAISRGRTRDRCSAPLSARAWRTLGSAHPATDGGRIGEDGLRAIIAEFGSRSAATTVRGLQDAVISASPDALRDDATLLVVAPHD